MSEEETTADTALPQKSKVPKKIKVGDMKKIEKLIAEAEAETEEVRQEYDLLVTEAGTVRTPSGRRSWSQLENELHATTLERAKALLKVVTEEVADMGNYETGELTVPAPTTTPATAPS